MNATAGEAADSSLSFSMGLSLPKFCITDGGQLAFKYNYTKVERAVELLRRSEPPSSVGKIIAKSLSLSYPRADHYVGDDKRSLAYLADVLVLRFTTMSSMFSQEWIERSVLQLEIIFLDQVSDRFNGGSVAPSVATKGSGQLLVNVSGELTFISQGRLTSSVMSLEDVYSPDDGRMYLIGCRDLRLQWRNLAASGDLEEGMGCSIEVKVQYPPWNTHWLIWWTAKVQIVSTRNAGDPLRFDTMKLQAVPFQFPQVWRGKLNGGLANGVLCVTLLSAVVVAELGQLRHLKTHADVAPYVSLVMLGVQALGFGTPLVTGIEALRARVTFTLGSDMADYALISSRPYQSMDKAVKVISLVALVLPLRLCQKVWRSRARVPALLSPSARGRVPGDAEVFVCHCAVHVVLIVLILALNGEAMTVEQHVGLMQDLFLLPQVIGNATWRVNCKPLAESYYLGVTAARLLPHVYDYVRPPVVVGYLGSWTERSKRAVETWKSLHKAAVTGSANMGSNLQFLGVLMLLHLWVASSSFDPQRLNEQQHDYLRFASVERHCQAELSSAARLADDVYRVSRVMRELPFEKGDWRQDAGHAPLMPFDGGDVPTGASGRLLDPLYLATLVITHFDDQIRARTAVNVSGVLDLSVSRKNRDPKIWPPLPIGPLSPEFKLSPGGTNLKIIFEGVYMERDDGERVLCMVGSAVLPTRSTGGADPWDWAKDSGRSGFLPPVTADDNILLVLRYPKELTLTTRAVLGEMRSSSAPSASAYFDPVQLVSQLRWSLYQFRSDDLVAGACSPLPSIFVDDVVGNRASRRYNGSYLCEVLNRYAHRHGSVVTALPNGGHCNSTATSASCRAVGPFEMDRDADEDELALVGIVMQDLYCHTDAAGTARVSVVFRAMPPWEDRYTAAERSGLSGTTLSAEGVWMASAGQTCLVACRGIGNRACHFRVRLFMPLTFSITGRSVLLGRITSIRTATGAVAHSSLSFQHGLTLPEFWGYNGERLAFTYNYTKVKLASEILLRSQRPLGLRETIAKSLSLSYPKADGDHKRGLTYLAGNLALRFMTMPSMFASEWMERPVLYLEIKFVGHVRDHFVPRFSYAFSERQLLINVSAELMLIDLPRVTASVMSLEGVYDPEDGRMCLIGCRDPRLPWRNMSTSSIDLEEGMDCSIEVKVQYPPTTTHWFIWSTAKVQIASTRNAGDPLRFDTVKLQAIPRYPQPRPGELNRGLANGALCVTLLSISIAAALSQLRHLKTHADVAPYVSLVMLGVQALGFGMPLISGIEALLARVTLGSDVAMPPSPEGPRYALIMDQLYQSMDKAVKVLSLAAIVLTLRLGQTVWRSRERVLARSSPLEPERVPGDSKVFVCHYAVHLALFVLILALNGEAMTVEQHIGLMSDLFLLPQVTGNAVWRVNCKPLAESYYLSVTAARLLPHVYDGYVRPPAVVWYSLEPLNASRFVHSSARDVVIPAISILLGFVVYVQQRWNYAIVSRMGMAEQRKLQHVF
ncbi:hypothetical protein BAE44_0021515 [Dichanthelium oligosanthes]|uniref:RING-type E3 ubiquitin transferase n=1 Tax=Dichanthelium oligosanthes TaxID=888268 RepID=A0A1E5UXD7_9POAL|nr:hypothetical protein BAE44_0021515 [Dichanthelium oligosanthes]